MASQELKNKIWSYKAFRKANGITEELINYYVMACKVAIEQEKDIRYGLKMTAITKCLIEKMVAKGTKVADVKNSVWELEKYCFENKLQPYSLVNMYYDVLLLEARNKVLDSYLQYVEKNREPAQRFYRPKRKCFMKIGLVQALQDLLDDKLDMLSISMPPGTGKSTLEKFFHSGICGWYPEEYNLFFSHSAGITRMYYDGVLAILTDNIEYTWNEIFPDLQVTNTNAKMEQINIGAYKPFMNVQTASVGSEMAGKVRASKMLFVDDMIGKIDEALNKNTLDKLWNTYTTDARQRRVTGCKELIIATRWSVHDPIGRLMLVYEGNPRYRFISIPDIDETTGKSNFDFEYNGFSIEFFRDQELLMDDISYKCLYKNQPVEREGLLYHEEDIRRFSTLPSQEPDAILSICDAKAKGIDYMVMPIVYQYGNDYYMVDTICNNENDYDIQYTAMTKKIIDHNIQKLQIEANMGGDRISHELSQRLDAIGHRCNVTSKYTESNKETKIIVNAEWVKKHVLFKNKQDYTPKSDYGVFMEQLLSYSVAGKNKHDDVCDAMAMFALFVTRGMLTVKTEIFDRRFFGL